MPNEKCEQDSHLVGILEKKKKKKLAALAINIKYFHASASH